MGKATDMGAFFSVVKSIAAACKEDSSHKIIVEKSTVPLGTASKVRDILETELKLNRTDFDNRFSIISNPEFLAEGSAIKDLTNPQRVVLGTSNDGAFELLNALV
jgi:UDPglucose 6-dehydrogenase